MTEPAETWTQTALTDGGETNTWSYTETDDTYDTGTSDADFGLLEFAYATPTRLTPPTTRAPSTGTRRSTRPRTWSGWCPTPRPTRSPAPATPPGRVHLGPGRAEHARRARQRRRRRRSPAPPRRSTTTPSASPLRSRRPTPPTPGNVSMTRQASGDAPAEHSPGRPSRRTPTTPTGGVEDAYDADGNETATSYTANSDGLTTGVQVAAPSTTYTTPPAPSPRRTSPR